MLEVPTPTEMPRAGAAMAVSLPSVTHVCLPHREAEASHCVTSASTSHKPAAGPGPSRCCGEPAAGRHEGLGALGHQDLRPEGDGTSHHEQRWAGVSQQPNSQLRVGDSGAGQGSAASDAQLCDFLFLLEGCFRQSRELLGAPSLLQLCFYNSSRIWLEGAWSQVSSLRHHYPTGPAWLRLP